ncbi:Protein sax-3 [Portunus trituberculatus]|uniref:Protein sax-3 n=1 Tax=Portunus trituberculatus TaxID=210409 RepID=A0A5B7FST8_PORTR|nr:Protein sax-3 [Portunus trituberculatus]
MGCRILGVNEGESAVFECDPPKGHPTPVVTWRLDERDLILPRHRYRQDGSTLMVSHVVPSDEGEYQCVVTNMAGRRVSEVAQLTVYESARVGGVVKSMVGVAGHDVTLPCVPSGKPDPQVVWRRADGLMPVGRAAMGRDWSLTITALRSGDQGTYVCEATNSAGTHAANTSLLVVERPRAEGGVRPRIAVITPSHVRQIGCPITATPTPIIFWVKENHGRQEAQREAGHTLTGDGEDVYLLEEEQPWVVASGAAATMEKAAPIVDHTFSLHVTTRHEGLWACMAANEARVIVSPCIKLWHFSGAFFSLFLLPFASAPFVI